jgi:uncharacterized alkaline shock family protein YloU
MEEKKDSKKENNNEEFANIKISTDVVEVIAGVAANEVQGVSEMTGGFAGGFSEIFSGKKNMAKGIKATITENKVVIDVNIIVEYGARIPDVAFEIQKRVKKAVENMTGLDVEEVNVHVQGVATPGSKKPQKEEKPEEEKKPVVKATNKKEATKKTNKKA